MTFNAFKEVMSGRLNATRTEVFTELAKVLEGCRNIENHEEVDLAIQWWNKQAGTKKVHDPIIVPCSIHPNKKVVGPVSHLKPFKEAASFSCHVCGNPVCGFWDDCSIEICLDCNPTIDTRNALTPCSFHCQTLYILRNSGLEDQRGNHGYICQTCHNRANHETEYSRLRMVLEEMKRLHPDNERFLNLIEEYMGSKIICNFRTLIYMGDDKLRYLIRCKDFVPKFAMNFANELSDELVYSGEPLGSQEGSNALSLALTTTLDETGRTPKLRPWKVLKMLARLVIIFKRYQHEYYNPDNGKFVVKAAANFNNQIKKRKLMN